MGTVHDIAEALPHLVIDCSSISKVVHVVPLDNAFRWVDGTLPLPSEDILRVIIRQWLLDLDENPYEPSDAA